MTTYIKFGGAIATCITAACDVNAIKDFFLDYLGQSQKSIADQLKTVLDPWTGNFSDIQQIVVDLQGLFETITASSREVQNEISGLGAAACKEAKGCAQSTLKRYNDQGRFGYFRESQT